MASTVRGWFSLALLVTAVTANPVVRREASSTASSMNALPTVDLEYAIYSGTTTNVSSHILPQTAQNQTSTIRYLTMLAIFRPP
jgi:hypothetical protein